MSKRMPSPGFDGTYRDTCIVCFRGTDTAVVFEGEAEWHVGMLVVLGMPRDQARGLMLEDERFVGMTWRPGQVPMDAWETAYRLCAKCADSKVKVAPIYKGSPIYTYRQPLEQREL